MEEIINDQKKEADIEEEMLARVNVLQEVSKSMAEELGREAKRFRARGAHEDDRG